MTKHRFRDSIKSLFGSHLDPETEERLKGSKSDVDDKVNKIKKLIKSEDLGVEDHDQSETGKNQSIDELIDDFHKDYKVLYEQYDTLTGELRRKFQKRREKESSSSSSSSDSDSDDSSKKKVSKDERGLERELQEVGDIKQELEAALSEVADLKRVLATTIKEHESLNSEHLTALNKIQDADGIIRDLKVEAETWDAQKSKLLLEVEALNLASSNAGKIEAELNGRLKGMETEVSSFIEEKESARRKIEEGEKTIVELKEKLSATMEEKETLNLKHLEAVNNVGEVEKIIGALRIDAEALGLEKSKCLLEIEGLSQKLSTAGEIQSELNGRLKDIETEKETLIKEKETAWSKIDEGDKIVKELNATIYSLRSQLTATVEDKEALTLEHGTALSKINEAEKIIADMRAQAESLDLEKSDFLLKIEEQNQKLSLAKNLEADLNRKLKDLEMEKDKLIEEKEIALRTISEAEKAKEELDSTVEQLKRQLTATVEEKEALNLVHLTTLTRVQEADTISRDMKVEAETWGVEKSKFQLEIEELNQKLGAARKLEAQLNERLKDIGKENDNLVNEKEAAQRTIEEGQKVIEELNIMTDQVKEQLTATIKEKEVLNLDHATALSKIVEADQIIVDMKTQAEIWGVEKADLLLKIEEMSQRLSNAVKIEAELNGRLKDIEIEKDGLIKEREIAWKEIEQGKTVREELNVMVDQLNSQLTTTVEEKKALNLEYTMSLSRLQEANKIIEDLKVEAETWDLEKTKLLLEVEGLNQRLSSAAKLETELNEKLNVGEIEKVNLMKEKETAWRRIEEGEKIIKEVNGIGDQLKEENRIFNLKIVEISSEIQLVQQTNQELVSQLQLLKEDLGVTERERSTLVERHEVHVNESLTRINMLEAQVTRLETELQLIQTREKDLLQQLEIKVAEAKQLGEENTGLLAQVSEIEVLLRERENELSILLKKLEDSESQSSSSIENLTLEINRLLEEVNSVNAQKGELEERMICRNEEASLQVKGLTDQVDTLQLQLEFQQNQKVELELQLERTTQTITEYTIQIQKFNEEIADKISDQQRLLKEKENLVVRIKDLESAFDSLCNEKRELEEKLKHQMDENSQFREEKLELEKKFFELEGTLTDRGVELSTLHEKHRSVEAEASSQKLILVAQFENLQEKLNSLQNEKSEIELRVEREKNEFLDNLTQLEKEKVELLNSIADHQINLKEHEDAYKKLNDEYKLVEDQFRECKVKLDNAEMKMAEMAQEFRKDIRSKDQVKDDLELMVEDLKSDLEVKTDEINTLVENARTIEVKLRLSNQKLRVTDQLLTEKEEMFRKAELKYLEEQRLLEERIHGLSATIVANNKAHQKTISTVSDNINSNLTQLECIVRKFDLDYAKYEKCVVETSHDLQFAKSWVSKAIQETERLRKEVINLGEQLQDKRERESILIKQVEKLEIKANKEGSEKDGLVQAVHQLEKRQRELEEMMEEKNEGMLGLKEEKKEAIRQLCILIEYHRSRYDFLKDEVLKLNVKGGQSVRYLELIMLALAIENVVKPNDKTVVHKKKKLNLLHEPSGFPVYQCAGRGAVLRAKSEVPLNEKKDSGSSEEYESLSEQRGGSSLGGASDSEWGNPIMEPNVKERALRSRRTVFSNSPIRANGKEDIDEYEGIWPMQRIGDKEVGLVEEIHSQFSEQRIETWVRRNNLEQDMNVYDSVSPSTALYGNSIGAARSRANFEHQRIERDAFTGYSANSVAVADRQGVRNFCYPSDRPSSSNLDMFYGHPEPIRNYGGPIEGLDPNRAELLRRLDELKDQIIKSSDVGDKPRVVADRALVDPYYGRATYNVPMQSSTKSPQQIHGPHYFDRGNVAFPVTGPHQRNNEDFLRPPRQVVKDMLLYEDQFQEQMKRKTNYSPTHQYPPRLPREHYLESFVDFKQDPLSPSHTEEAFFHHPACSCSQCSKRNRQDPPLQAPYSPISNASNPKVPIKSSTYQNENPITVGLKASDLQRAGRFPSQDTLPHSRQPSELDSVVDGFGLVQPRKAPVLRRSGKPCDAIAGGAPFIVCISCFELLKLPRKIYKLEMDWQKLQCGACSVVVVVKVENRRLVVRVPPEIRPREVSPDDGSPTRVVNVSNSLESSDNSSHKLINTEHNKPSDDQDSNVGESKKQELTSSPIFSKEKEIPAINCDLKNLLGAVDLPSKDTPSLTNSNENFDNPSYHEPSKYKEGSEYKQNTVIVDVTEPSVLDVSFEDYSNIHVSQDFVETNKEEEEEEENQSKIKSSQDSEPFFVDLSRNNLRDFSRSSEIPDRGKPTISVNGQPLPAHVVKKAEKLAGPILPGDYWYDYQAGFWGVMGHPCLGIIPPFIDEFTYPMSRNCAAGNTGIFVNGRELHKRDLELLSSRGLPTTTNKFYRIDISGKAVNEDSEKEVYSLGKLAPTIEKVKHGFGMKVPRSLK